MTTIVTRAGKGSPLTNAEVDANFTNLNTGKVETTFAGVVAALGYTPYNATNPSSYVDAAGARSAISATGSLSYNSTTGVLSFTDAVTSVAGKTGAVTLSTSDVSEGSNLYYTDARARAAISATGSLSYNSTTGVISFSDAVTSVFGRTGAVTLQSSDVTGALGYTPYNSTNPSGYVTSSGSVNYANTAGSSNLANAKWQSAAIAGSQGSNVSAVEVRNNGGTGDSNLANITFHCQGYYGTSLHLRPDGYFGVGGWSASSWRWYVNLGNGDMVAAGNVTAYSDERLKKDWGTLPDDFVEQLAAVKHGTYTRIDSGARQVGVSAQSLQGPLPEAVGLAEDGDTLQVAYGNAALVAAVQLAQKLLHTCDRVAQLEAKLAKIAGEG